MANFANGSFEAGSLSGWSSIGIVAVREGSISLGNSTDSNAGFSPTEGNYLAQLSSQDISVGSVESFLNLPNGYFNNNFDQNKDNNYSVGSAIKQSIEIHAGQTLSFSWKFKTTDYWNFNDTAFVITGASASSVSDVYSSGNGGAASGTYNYEFSESGTYTIGVAVFNESDSGVDSYLGVDNFRLSQTTNNDAPTTTSLTLQINEDTPYTFSQSDFSFSDPDTADTLKSVLITATPANGQLLYDGSTVSIGTSGFSIAGANLAKLSFSPAANANGDDYASFKFKVLDQSDAASQEATATINVNPVNDAPTTTALTLQINEDTPYTFSQSDFSFSDPDTADTLKSVLITATPANGQLLYDGSTVSIGTSGFYIAGANLTKLSFSPAANANGDAYTSFKFKVLDQSDAASQEATATFNVTPVNDAPLSIGVVSNLEEAYESGIAQTGVSLPATDANGVSGALIQRIYDPDGTILSVTSARSNSATGVSNTTSWTQIDNSIKIIQGLYGSLSLSSDGSYNYRVDDQSEIFKSLLDGQRVTDQFSIQISDGDAQATQQEIIIGVNGRDDVIKPTVNTVATDDRVNLSEKVNGVTLTGTAPGATKIDVSWGDITKIVNVINGSWSALFASTYYTDQYGISQVLASEIPIDGGNQSVRVKAYDANLNISAEVQRQVMVDTLRPRNTTIDAVTVDNIINANEKNTGITISGQSENGSTVKLQWNDQTKITTASTNGSWSFSIGSSEIPDDTARFSFRTSATDAAGNPSVTTRKWIEVDTKAPDNIVFNKFTTDEIINSEELRTGFHITGKIEAGCSLELYWNGSVYQPFVSGLGRWSQAISERNLATSSIGEAIVARVKDSAGNVYSASPITPVFDLVAPTIPIVNPIGTTSGGLQVINSQLKKDGVIVSGVTNSLEAGCTMTVNWDGVEMSTKSAADGSWQVIFNTNSVPRDSEYSKIIVQAIDPAGNKSEAFIQSLVIDTKAPDTPRILTIASDDQITSSELQTGLTIQGTTDPGTAILLDWLTINRTTNADSSGRWVIALDLNEIRQLDKKNSTTIVSVQAIDRVGNRSATVSKQVKLSTTNAATPTLDTVAGDNKINLSESNSGILLTGTAESNCMVKATLGNSLIQVTADNQGIWRAFFREKILPRSDGEVTARVTATNASRIESEAVSRTLYIDRSAPMLTKAYVSGSKIGLIFSEDLISTSLSAKNFSVVDDRTNLTVLGATVASTNTRLVELSMDRALSSNTTLKISFSGNTSILNLADSSGNAAANFRNITTTSFVSTQSVSSLAQAYTELVLLGTDPITGIGNAQDNKIIGNESNNSIDGGGGADTVTGGGGADIFRYTVLTNSLLAKYDKITDLSTAIDRIDGPNTIGSANIHFAGEVSALNAGSLEQLLTGSRFVSNGASIFTYTNVNTTQTFLALNDVTAGFNANRDAIIEITGYSGALGNLLIV